MGMRDNLRALLAADPEKALHVTGGRIRNIQTPDTSFVAAYLPHGATDEYLLVLSVDADAGERRAAVKSLVRHHVERHAQRQAFVLRRAGSRCSQCSRPMPRRHQPPTPGWVRRSSPLAVQFDGLLG